jgi:hypothetical protein
MLSHLITFQETFAPQVPNDSTIIKEIVDSLGLVVGLGSAFVWNFRTMTLPKTTNYY